MHNLTRDSLSNLIFSSLETSYFSFKGCYNWPIKFGFENTETTNLKSLEELYRSMKQKASSEHDQPQVSRWHYREKLMAMKRGGSGIFEAVVLYFYWATSGFGERAVRAGVCLLTLLLLPFIANSPIGHAIRSMWYYLPDFPSAAGFFKDLSESISASAALEYIPFTKDIKGEGWAKVGQALWQGIVMLQFTLFALAVRNRFRR